MYLLKWTNEGDVELELYSSYEEAYTTFEHLKMAGLDPKLFSLTQLR